MTYSVTVRHCTEEAFIAAGSGPYHDPYRTIKQELVDLDPSDLDAYARRFGANVLDAIFHAPDVTFYRGYDRGMMIRVQFLNPNS